jgi:predicted HTH transcriptional regulator
MKMSGKLLMKLMEFIPEDKSVSVHQLTCRSGLDHRTIKKYLELIMAIQGARKIVKEQVGLRVLVKKEQH